MENPSPTMKDVWRAIEAGAYALTAEGRALPLARAYDAEGRLEAEFRADLAAAIGSEARVPPWVASALSDLAWRKCGWRGDEGTRSAWVMADDIIAALTTEEPAP